MTLPTGQVDASELRRVVDAGAKRALTDATGIRASWAPTTPAPRGRARIDWLCVSCDPRGDGNEKAGPEPRRVLLRRARLVKMPHPEQIVSGPELSHDRHPLLLQEAPAWQAV